MANNGIYYSSGHSLSFTTSGITWATLTSGGTFTIDTVSGGTYLNLPSTTFTGGTVTGATIFTGGLTANTLNVTGDTTLANVTGTSFYTDYIDFNLSATPTHSEGRLHWLDDTKTLQLDTEVSDFAIELGHQNIVRVRNTTGSPLAKGRIVYITGGSGNRPTVTLANYSGDSTSARTLGFIAEEIAHNSNGYVITYGLIRGTTSTPLDTSAYSAGTQLYLYTGGTFNNVRPVAPLHEVRVGVVISSNANEGIIFVSIMNGYELEELHDVRISGKSEGDLVIYDSTLNVWENSKTLNGSYQITGTLSAGTISATTYQNLPQSTSGAGTTNYVSKWTGSTGLGDSLIQDDGTQVYISTVPTHAGTKFNSGGPIEVGEGVQILGRGGSIGITDTDLQSWTTTGNEIAIGNGSPLSASQGDQNIAIGYGAQQTNDTGTNNIAIGRYTLLNNQSGQYNLALGDSAGENITTGSYNVLIGSTAGNNLTTEDNRLYISNSTSTLIYGEFDNNIVNINGTLSATTYDNLPGSSSANCFTDFFVTNISGCSPVNMLSPLNVQDGLSVTGTSTFTSLANFTGGLSANTFSAETYQNLPSFNSVQIDGTSQFSGNTNNYINFSGVNITITSAATNTLVFSAGTGVGGGVTSLTAGTGLSGNSTTGDITLTVTGVSASQITDSTTLGQNLVTLSNPSEIRYLRINADNSVSTLTASQLKSDLGFISQIQSTQLTNSSTSVSVNISGCVVTLEANTIYIGKMTIASGSVPVVGFSLIFDFPSGTSVLIGRINSAASTTAQVMSWTTITSGVALSPLFGNAQNQAGYTELQIYISVGSTAGSFTPSFRSGSSGSAITIYAGLTSIKLEKI